MISAQEAQIIVKNYNDEVLEELDSAIQKYARKGWTGMTTDMKLRPIHIKILKQKGYMVRYLLKEDQKVIGISWDL